MNLPEYLVLFVLVAIMGAGLPGPGDAALIAAGTLAGEGRLNVWTVLATAIVAWMLGSLAGYEIGMHEGRGLLDHPGRLAKSRLKLLVKGDRAFARHNFVASVTMPAFVSGIFRVRLFIFVLGALTAGIGWIGMYVGLSYFLGEEITKRIGKAGTRAVVGVIVIVIVGLCIRAGCRGGAIPGNAARLSRVLPSQASGIRGQPYWSICTSLSPGLESQVGTAGRGSCSGRANGSERSTGRKELRRRSLLRGSERMGPVRFLGRASASASRS